MMTTEYRAPQNATELNAAYSCLARSYDGSEHLSTINSYDPYFKQDNLRVCFKQGKALSLAQVFERPLRLGNCIVRLAGIGCVSTDPAYRGQGYSGHVLRDCLQYLQTQGYDLSFLYTGIPLHFNKAGWVLIPEHCYHLTLPENIATAPYATTIQPFDLEQDLHGVATVYAQFNRQRSGTLVRTWEYWQNLLKWRDYDSSLFWVAKQNDRVVAYLRGSRWALYEFGYLPKLENAMTALLSHFLGLAKAAKQNTLLLSAPMNTLDIFNSLGCSIERQQINSSMVQIISLPSLLKKIIPLLEMRLAQSPFPPMDTRLCLHYEADEATIDIKDAKITILTSNGEPCTRLWASQDQLLKLLFGYMTVEQICWSNHLNLPSEAIGLLNVLFPPGEFFMWEKNFVGF